jgi:NodT family efflux transporter outer membrane factor (OMF) lipoprotein
MNTILLLAAAALAEAPSDPWWDLLGDEELAGLVERGISASPDARIAYARHLQSQAMANQQRAGFLPSAGLSWSSTTQPQDALGFGFGLSSMEDMFPGMPTEETEEETEEEETELFTSGTAALRVDLPIDIWGRALRSWQAAEEDAEAAREQRTATELALAQSIAFSYMDIASAELRMDVAEEQLAAVQSLQELTLLMHERGEATALDLFQLEQQEASARAGIPLLSYQSELARQQLAVLLGESPRDLSVLPAKASIPVIGDSPGPSVSDLPGSRPDLRAAGRSVEAAKLRKAAAYRDLLPSLSIGGQVSRQSNLSDGDWDSIETWAMSSGMSLTLFQGGAKQAALEAADAAVLSAEQSYRQALLRAEQELVSAQSGDLAQSEMLEARLIQQTAAKRAYDEARLRYVQGLSPFVNVVTAQQALQQSQLSLIAAKRDRAAARVQLFTAAGWISSKPQNHDGVK